MCTNFLINSLNKSWFYINVKGANMNRSSFITVSLSYALEPKLKFLFLSLRNHAYVN